MYDPSNKKPERFAKFSRNIHVYRIDKTKFKISDSYLSRLTDDRVFMGVNDDHGLTRIGGSIEFHETFEQAVNALVGSCNMDIENAKSIINARIKKLEELEKLEGGLDGVDKV